MYIHIAITNKELCINFYCNLVNLQTITNKSECLNTCTSCHNQFKEYNTSKLDSK